MALLATAHNGKGKVFKASDFDPFVEKSKPQVTVQEFGQMLKSMETP